jgi:hypothetical protein
MTIKSLKKEKRINKDIYRDFPNSCNRVVICHNFQKAVIINHRPCAVPEGFSTGVSANKCSWGLNAHLPDHLKYHKLFMTGNIFLP